MNLRTFATVGAVAMLVLGGCIVTTTDGTGGSAGSAGSGGDGNTGNTGGGGGAGGATGGSGGGTAGAGGSAACTESCAEAITPDASGNTLTPCEKSEAESLYNALATCTCDTAAGKCATACEKSACAGTDPDADCTTCVQTECKTEFDQCANHI